MVYIRTKALDNSGEDIHATSSMPVIDNLFNAIIFVSYPPESDGRQQWLQTG